MTEPLTASEVSRLFLQARLDLHLYTHELVVDADRDPVQTHGIFEWHDLRLHALIKECAMYLKRIDLLKVLSLRAEEDV